MGEFTKCVLEIRETKSSWDGLLDKFQFVSCALVFYEIECEKFVDLVCCREARRKCWKNVVDRNLNISTWDPEYFLLLEISRGED